MSFVEKQGLFYCRAYRFSTGGDGTIGNIALELLCLWYNKYKYEQKQSIALGGDCDSDGDCGATILYPDFGS